MCELRAWFFVGHLRIAWDISTISLLHDGQDRALRRFHGYWAVS